MDIEEVLEPHDGEKEIAFSEFVQNIEISSFGISLWTNTF